MITNSLTAIVKVSHMLYPRSGFQSGDWCILACDIVDVVSGEPYANRIVIKGNVFSANYGKEYRFMGQYTDEPKYGPSYSITTFSSEEKLDDEEQQLAYVQSVCTKLQFDNLCSALGNPFNAFMAKDSDALQKAKGIGPKAAETLIKRFHEEYDNSVAYAALSKYGIPIASIASLLRKFTSPEACVAAVEKRLQTMIVSTVSHAV